MDVEQIEEMLSIDQSVKEEYIPPLAATLKQLGIESASDLALIREEDITCVVSVITARRLVSKWKQSKSKSNLYLVL